MKSSGKRAAAVGMLTGVMLLTIGVETAQAAVISETESFSILRQAPNSDTELLNFNRFNPALGTLTAVHFGLDSETATSAFVQVTAGNASATGLTVNATSYQVQVTSPSLGTILGPESAFAIAT